ncbi:siphovirus Gp157 family protein [Billgrantia azerbaijanica]|nr:siphovirus Gp157 family protein [Halomonas azerbaijanica]
MPGFLVGGNTMTTLYQLAEEFQQLASMDAENNEDFATALVETLDAQGSQLEEKIEATIIVAKQLDADAEACKAEAKRLMDRAKTFERNADACRDRVLWAMESTGRDKIKRQLFTITRTKPRDICAIEDASKVPEQYTKMIPESRQPVKADILKALKAGEEVPGCKLDSGKASLRIS